MQETTKTALFPLGQIVATPGALAALGKAGQPRSTFSRGTCAVTGANSTSTTAKRTNGA